MNHSDILNMVKNLGCDVRTVNPEIDYYSIEELYKSARAVLVERGAKFGSEEAYRHFHYWEGELESGSLKGTEIQLVAVYKDGSRKVVESAFRNPPFVR